MSGARQLIFRTSLCSALVLCLASRPCVTQGQALGSAFSTDYTLTNLGTPTGVPSLFGGLTLEAGSPDVLLIGGYANTSSGSIYAIDVTRDGSNHITGFSGVATLFSTAPYIDGGLTYGPGGVLFYTGYPTNQIGEIKPGSTSPDKVISASGVASSVGSLAFVPAGFGGAGSFKVLSYNGGGEYQATLTPDGSGTYDMSGATLESTPGRGPEGIVYVAGGNADFPVDSALLAEYGTGTVGAYTVDSNGDLVVASRQDFITGLSGAEGGFVDPLTGDFLFSTFGGGDKIIEVSGFTAPAPGGVPEPGTLAFLTGLALPACWLMRRRRA